MNVMKIIRAYYKILNMKKDTLHELKKKSVKAVSPYPNKTPIGAATNISDIKREF
jgi:hypothetical protein